MATPWDKDGDCVVAAKDCNDRTRLVGQCNSCQECVDSLCVSAASCKTIAPEELDTDGDGLSDQQEIELKTGIDKADSDDDLVSDYLEAIVDKTNPLDPNSNLLSLNYSKYADIGYIHEISVSHPLIGTIAGINFEVISPSGKKAGYMSNEAGIASFSPDEEGIFLISASAKSFRREGSFTARPKMAPFIPGNLVESRAIAAIVGDEASVNPFYFYLLAISFIFLLVFWAVVLSNIIDLKAKYARLEIIFIAGVYSIIPLLLGKLTNIWLSAAAIIIQLAILIYIKKNKAKARKQ